MKDYHIAKRVGLVLLIIINVVALSLAIISIGQSAEEVIQGRVQKKEENEIYLEDFSGEDFMESEDEENVDSESIFEKLFNM